MEANSHLVYSRLSSLLTLTLGSGGARPSAEDWPMYQHLVILVAVKALASTRKQCEDWPKRLQLKVGKWTRRQNPSVFCLVDWGVMEANESPSDVIDRGLSSSLEDIQ
jgi:hypothetical protein